VSRSFAAAPTIYANGVPIGTIPADSDFYDDFAPGSYRFTVQPYGAPTGQSLSVQLQPGSRTYIVAQWLPVWEAGLPSVGRGADSHSFFLFNMTPRLPRAYLPSLTSLGQG